MALIELKDVSKYYNDGSTSSKGIENISRLLIHFMLILIPVISESNATEDIGREYISLIIAPIAICILFFPAMYWLYSSTKCRTLLKVFFSIR